MKDCNVFFVDIAGVTIKIMGNNAVSKAIINDLGARLVPNKTNCHISIEISDNNIKEYQAKVFSAKGSMNFNEYGYFVDYMHEVNYLIEHLFDSKDVNIKINVNKKGLKKRIKQFLGDKKVIEKNAILSYSLFWYVLHFELSKHSKSFIHAGVFESKNGATIIAGTGGCGKTSTLFKILENNEVKYMSEDFGIIDSNGFCYYNPKPVSIYASDMEFGQSILQNFYKSFSISEKFIWRFKRIILGINPMIKAKPDKLMNGRIVEKSKIKNVLYFVRNNDLNLRVEKIKKASLVERVVDSSMRELKTFNELLLLIRANAPHEYNIPSFGDVRKQSKEICFEAFANTQNKIIYIPHKTSPEVLVSFLMENELI
jgi:hypothetical protein